MTDKPDEPVSVRKNRAADKPAADSTPLASRGSASETNPRPSTIQYIVVALLLSGICAVIAAVTLYGEHDYLVGSLRKSLDVDHAMSQTQVNTATSGLGTYVQQDLSQNTQLSDTAIEARSTDVQKWVEAHLPKANVSSDNITSQAQKMHDSLSSALGGLSGATISTSDISTTVTNLKSTFSDNLNPLSEPGIQSQANKIPSSQTVANVVLLLALGFVSMAVWRGRHWSRWAVIGLWALATLTGTLGGLSSLLSIGSDVPALFKVFAAVAGLAFLAAVVMTFMPTSAKYFAANRPAPPAGMPARRGLFAPRPAPASRTATAPATPAAETEPDKSGSNADRARAKQRATAESAAKGAELARSRAKASKSRRTGTAGS